GPRPGAGVRRRRHGGGSRSSGRDRRRAWASRRAGLHVSGGERSGGRAGVSRNRAAQPRRLLPVRCRLGPPAGRAPSRGCGLCGGRRQSAHRAARRGGAEASQAVEIAMPTVLIGIAALLIILWLLQRFAKADPQTLMRNLRTTGGISALAGAVLLGATGRIGV